MFVYGRMNGWGWALMSLGRLVLLVLVALAVTLLLRHAPTAVRVVPPTGITRVRGRCSRSGTPAARSTTRSTGGGSPYWRRPRLTGTSRGDLTRHARRRRRS